MLLSYDGFIPKLGQNVFLAPGSHIIGQVEIGDDSSIWFNCVLRGDVSEIIIGKGTNIQDGAVLHGALFPNRTGVLVGDNVIVGHNCILHACTIGNGCLIGMGAVVLNRARIGEGSLIGAGSVVTQDAVIPPGVLAQGTPAKVIRELTPEEHLLFGVVARNYSEEGIKYERLLREAGINSGAGNDGQ
ncbi:MAG: gamma carbonic anhydrase family protein [Clostridia bacterium]|nr:gamma carbonic anhydrase family protein [Clostridia bacterium]